MFGLHRRTRSLIPVKDLAKYDKIPSSSVEELPPTPSNADAFNNDVDDDDDDTSTLSDDSDYGSRSVSKHRARRQLFLVLAALLAAATTSASLHPAFTNLLLAQQRSDGDPPAVCADLAFTYARSVLDCAFALGTLSGVGLGRLADALGRRPVMVGGLFGMAFCCFAMGGAGDSFWGAAAVEVAAGVCWASCWVGGVAAIGDITSGSLVGNASPVERRMNLMKGLPALGVAGAMGPAIDGLIAGIKKWESWERVPLLRGRVVSGLLVLGVAFMAGVWMEETLRSHGSSKSSSSIRRERAADSEKAAFLGQEFSFPVNGNGMNGNSMNGHGRNGSIHNSSTRAADPSDLTLKRQESVAIGQFVKAPSFLALLASFSLLSLHAATFDVLLPHLGHNPSQQGGLGIPCAWLGFTVFAGRAAAAGLIYHYLPRLVSRHGMLKAYRACSAFFPVLYALTPSLVFLAASAASYTTSYGSADSTSDSAAARAATATASTLVAAISAMAIAAKQLLTDAACVIVVLLSLAAAPDAQSTGTLIGLMQAAALCRSLAFAAVGAATFLADNEAGGAGWRVGWVNAGLWMALAVTGVVGSIVAWGVKERMSVGRDFEGGKELSWEVCFEADDI